MRATSNRELARQLGVSETAVRRAEKAGRIRREADGSWDPARVKAAWSDNTDQAQQRPARSGRPAVKRRSLKPVPEAAVGAVRDTLREHGEPIAAAGAMTFMQARTANEVLKAQERRVRLQRLKGELVDRAKAVAQVFRLARDERGQPDRVIHREARRQHADIVEMLDQRLAVERLAGPAWVLVSRTWVCTGRS
jgi:hypothetical protein